MTQEKQNSIRILQNKSTKKNFSKSIVFILGLFIGFIISSILFLILFNTNQFIKMEKNTSETLQQNEFEKLNALPSESNHGHNEEEEDSSAYKQHVNEKDLKDVFKHGNNKIETKNLNKTSPFEQFNGSEKKNLTVIQPPLAKPITKEKATEPKIKKILALKTEEKQINTTSKEIEEVSPIGSVKVSIDRRYIENRP